jgi:hypothetical protein
MSGASSSSASQDLTNYRIVAAGADGEFGTRDDTIVPIKAVIYDATTNTVTLSPKHRLNLHRRYMLIVNGSTPTGVADMAGNLLDGNGDGKPGASYAAILRGFGLDKPGVTFNKLIRDQLHGQPLSSYTVLAKHARQAPLSRGLPKVTGRVN